MRAAGHEPTRSNTRLAQFQYTLALARAGSAACHRNITALRIAPRQPLVSAVLAVVMARKAKDGASGRKSCASPTDMTRRGEIVEEIVDCLRPWKNCKSGAGVTAFVNRILKLLLSVPLDLKHFDRRLHRDHAKQLDGALLAVETLLASAPPALSLAFFDPVTITKDGVFVPLSTDEWERAYQKGEYFVGELTRLRKVCADAIHPGFGFHPNYDHLKYHCACSAYGLMRDLSDKKIAGTKDGAFWTITSLLYEVVSGKKNVALKRACDSALRDIRSRELGTH
jgi:hypothetical protein